MLSPGVTRKSLDCKKPSHSPNPQACALHDKTWDLEIWASADFAMFVAAGRSGKEEHDWKD